jgi:hypothetical protein
VTPPPVDPAQRLADAAILVAKADHYMVGLFMPAVQDLPFEAYADAHTILVNRELQEGKSPTLDLAFLVLRGACRLVHNVGLGY